MVVLEGKSVSKLFGALPAVDQVDFHLQQGEILGLIGPNGAGKTTPVNLVTGSYPVTQGEIFFEDEKIDGLKPAGDRPKGNCQNLSDREAFPRDDGS